jgi:regulator of nonsense transcripts 1
MFWNVRGLERTIGTSIVNDEEVTAVEDIVSMLLNGGVKPAQIGIISPYKAQVSALIRVFSHHPELKIASVDGFQGSERDYIVMSCVRSGGSIGFVQDVRRLNVSITRARYGLIIIGDSETLAGESPVWARLVKYFRDLGALQELTPRRRTTFST